MKLFNRLNQSYSPYKKPLLLILLSSTVLFTACERTPDKWYFDKKQGIWINANNPNYKPNDNTNANKNKPSNKKPPATINPYTDTFKVMVYNLYLMNTFISQWNQDQRAGFIANSESVKGQDVIVLNELFDDASSKIVLDGLKAEYPYQTPIIGRTYTADEVKNGDAGSNPKWNESLGNIDKTAIEDGGVAIISRYPIKEQSQYIYKDGCGTDKFGKKGFAYAVIDKNGMDYHIIGTHVQSDDKNCQAGEAQQIRNSQFTELRQFVISKKIPHDKLVFIAGDFNVIKGSQEYPKALATLGVNPPNVYTGLQYSFDTTANGITGHNYLGKAPEFLDYIFISKDHAQPTHWHNQAIDELSPRWERKGKFYRDLSDHYPVAGFAYADNNTRTHSYRFVNCPYMQIKLHDNQGNYLTTSNNAKSMDYHKLTLNAKKGDKGTSFNLDTWYPRGTAFCVSNNDFVQLKSNGKDGGYWGTKEADKADNQPQFWGAMKEQTAVISNKSLANLRIEIVGDDGDCLKNGDKVIFSDIDKNGKKGYFVKSALNNWLLSFDGKQSATQLTIEMADGKYKNWASKLKYKP